MTRETKNRFVLLNIPNQTYNMRLRTITENAVSTKTFYKGMTESNFEKFKKHQIPGFLSDLGMALIYADPQTMGKQNEPRIIIAVDINTDEIEDRRNTVSDMCGSWQDQSHPLYKKLRSSIWWSTSGGHGNRGIYCGVPKPYKILFKANPEDFRDIVKNKKIQDILNKNKHLENNSESTWHEFL